MNAYMNQYQQTQVTTASPERILIMLYDGAIRFAGQAKVAMLSGERLAKLEAISKAIAIVSYLSETLDHDAGWEQAEKLDGLYAYMIRELTNANLKGEVKSLEVVEDLLKELRETWMEAIEIVHQEKNKATAGEEAAAATVHNAPSPEDYQPLSVSL